MPETPAALSVRDLRKSYGSREVVRGLTMSAARGRLTAVLGPNGAGKTTTVECCEGLRRPDAGTVRVLGVDPTDRSRRQELSERVGVMLQDGGLPQAPPAGSVLTHLSRLYRDPVPPGDLLHRLDLQDVVRTPVRRLSGGQRQRLALAGALVGRPEMVFLDEPSAGLDPHSRHVVWDLLRELRDAGTSLLLTTHLMDEAEALADHVVIVDDGRVVAQGSPAELTGPTQVRATLATGSDVSLAAKGITAALRAGGREDLTAHAAGPQHVEVAARRGGAVAGTDGVDAGSSRVVAGSGDVDAGSDGVDAGSDGVDAGTVLAVTTALAQAGHSDAVVELHRHTLEDVFLRITGHGLRQDEEVGA